MLKKLMSFVGACALAMSLSATCFAQEAAPAAPPAARPQLNPWVDCGIGAMIFPNWSPGAVISNIIWDYGTTAVTSAASSQNTCEGHRAHAAFFINKTYNVLAAETAVGSGEYLNALGEIFQCEQGARADLTRSVREEVADAMARPGFADLERTAKAEVYFNVVDHLVRTDFAQQCQAT